MLRPPDGTATVPVLGALRLPFAGTDRACSTDTLGAPLLPQEVDELTDTVWSPGP